MKFFGHPIHLMLVHFPAALFPFEFVCSLLGFYTNNNAFVSASFFAMAGGVILGWAAITFGALDLINVFKENPDAGTTALIHGGINTCVVIVYTMLAYSQFMIFPSLEANGLTVLAIKAIVIGLMFFGNFLGGNLVLKYGIAVEK